MTREDARRGRRSGSGRGALAIAAAAEVVFTAVDSSLWGAMVDAATRERDGLVVLPVSWAAHEVALGRFDFSSGSLALRRLLDLVRAREACVCLRLGGSAATPIDLPGRLRARRSLFAVDPRGALVRAPGDATRFVPSAASTEALRERMAFLDAVGAVVSEAIAGGLRVVVDCGGALRAFASIGPFEADYHPASRALFWTFLEDRYGDVRELNDEYGASYETFSAVEPPTAFAPNAPGDLPAEFDWAAYQEFYRLWGAVKLKEAFAASLGSAVAKVKWACVLPRATVPFSVDESRRFFDHVLVEGTSSSSGRLASRVVLAMPREYARLEWIAIARVERPTPTSTSGSASPSTMRWAEFGFLDDIPAATREWRELWRGVATGGGGELVECDPSIEAYRRMAPALVAIPTFDFISIGTWRVIQAIAREGGVVAIGPRVPWLSAALKPFAGFGALLKQRVGGGELFDEFRVGRGRIIVVKPDGAVDSRRHALRTAVRALVPAVGRKDEDIASV